MIKQIKKTANWFLKQTKANQIALIFLALLAIAYFDKADIKKELKTLKSDRRRIDSTYVARINNLTSDFQQKIDKCNQERIKIYFEQNKRYKKKINELFLKTDQMYQNQQTSKK